MFCYYCQDQLSTVLFTVLNTLTILFASLLCLFSNLSLNLIHFFHHLVVSTISFYILLLFGFLETTEPDLVWWTALSWLHQNIWYLKSCCWALKIRMQFTKGDKSLCSDSYFDMLLPLNLVQEYMDFNQNTGGFFYSVNGWRVYLQLL